MGRGHSGTTPTDLQTLRLGVIFCPHWSLNAKSGCTLQNMDECFCHWFQDVKVGLKQILLHLAGFPFSLEYENNKIH